MKLFDVPNNTRVRIVADVNTPICGTPVPTGTVLLFKRIDGMYSYCIREDGEVVHPICWTEVEFV